MIEEYGLQLVEIPEDRHIPEELKTKPKVGIYMSDEFLETDVEKNRGKTAIVLISGYGVERVGLWSLSVCVNEDLELGSMLPYVDICRSRPQGEQIPIIIIN